MPHPFIPTALRALLVLLVFGLVAIGCAPAATQPPTATETQVVTPEAEAAEEPLPEVPAPAETLPRRLAPDIPVEEEPTEEEPAQEEPAEEEPEEEEPTEEEPTEEEPAEAEPVEEVAAPGDDTLELAINVGGPEVEVAGMTWTADQFFEGGRTTANAQVTEIEGTDNDPIYLSARTADVDLGTFSYSIPVPQEGVYAVTLHFAELYWGAPGAGSGGGEGSRVFNVSFEGGAVELSGIDINAEAGPMTALVKVFEVPVADGVLDIDFGASVNRPKLAGIEVSGPLDFGQ